MPFRSRSKSFARVQRQTRLGWFFIDLISSIPLELVTPNSSLSISKLAKVLRVLKFL